MYKRADGRWCEKVLENGIITYVYAKTERELLKKLRQREFGIHHGDFFEDVAADWKEEHFATMKPNSRKPYNGAYNRAVNTQYSGAKTKEFAVAFQSLVVTEEDCGSDLTIGIDVTDKNVSYIKWRWIKDPRSQDGYTLLTPDNYKSYIGKHVEYRSPMLCKSDNLCWRCMGELYKRIGIKNAGLASQRLTSTFMNASLKSMHDQTQKLTTIDWKKCIYAEE